MTKAITYLPTTMEQKLSKIIERQEKLNKLAEVSNILYTLTIKKFKG